MQASNKDAILVVIDELNVLSAQIDYEIARAEAQRDSGREREAKGVVKAQNKAKEAYDEALGDLHGKFTTLLTSAGKSISEIGVMPYYDKSQSYADLVTLHTKWDDASHAVRGDMHFDYARALTELAAASGLATKAKSEVKIDQEEAKKQAEYKGRYESKVQRLKEVNASIEGHVGSEPDVKLLLKALTAGENALPAANNDHVQEPKYHKAFLAIKEVVDKTSDIENRALAGEKDIMKGLAKDPAVSQKHELAVQALATLFVKDSELITKGEHTTLQKEVNAALTLCSTNKTKGIGALEKLTTKFNNTHTEKSRDRTECNRLRGLVETSIETLSYNPDEDGRASLNDWSGLLRMAGVDISNCDFATAKGILATLETETTDAVGTSTTKKSDFEAIWNDPKHVKMREDILKSAAPPPPRVASGSRTRISTRC